MQTSQHDLQQVNNTNSVLLKDFPYDERLSSWEMSQMWLIYQVNSQIKCILQYYVTKAQDPDIKAVLTDALNKTTNQLDSLKPIFDSVGFPIPHGFNDEDVDPNAERLFSDSLMLIYLRTFNKSGLVN